MVTGNIDDLESETLTDNSDLLPEKIETNLPLSAAQQELP